MISGDLKFFQFEPAEPGVPFTLLFIDDKLKKGEGGGTERRGGGVMVLDKSMILRFQEKRMPLKYYKRHLARRLLNQNLPQTTKKMMILKLDSAASTIEAGGDVQGHDRTSSINEEFNHLQNTGKNLERC